MTVHALMKCPNCGAPADLHAPAMGPRLCSYCRAPLPAPSDRSRPLLALDPAGASLAGWMAPNATMLSRSPGPPAELVGRFPACPKPWTIVRSEGTFDAFEVSATVRVIEGDQRAKAGLYVRFNPAGTYMIVVSTIGTYTIAYVPVPTGPAVTLVDWSSAASLRQGLGAANELTVTCEGDRMTLAINGQAVAALRDGRSRYGAVELFAAGPRSPVGLAVGGLTVRAAGVAPETGSEPGSTVGRTELVLRSVDASRKIHLIAAVRKITGLGIAGSRALVEGVPCVVKKGLSAAEAEAAKRALEAAGGRAEVRG